jgi:hypothetical protein
MMKGENSAEIRSTGLWAGAAGHFETQNKLEVQRRKLKTADHRF